MRVSKRVDTVSPVARRSARGIYASDPGSRFFRAAPIRMERPERPEHRHRPMSLPLWPPGTLTLSAVRGRLTIAPFTSFREEPPS